jgi:hypothetical protein
MLTTPRTIGRVTVQTIALLAIGASAACSTVNPTEPLEQQVRPTARPALDGTAPCGDPVPDGSWPRPC